MTSTPRRTLWVFGDQMNPDAGVLRDADPASDRILLVESTAKLHSQSFHRQRAHVVLCSMQRLAYTLVERGFEVDHRRAESLRAGYHDHVREFQPIEVVAMEPMSFDGAALVKELAVSVLPNDQFLCSYQDFKLWTVDRKRLRMEDFYRHQRRVHDYLMDGDEPCGGTWNLDAENRRPPPKQPRAWPAPVTRDLDDIDREVLSRLPDNCWGDDPTGIWPTSREHALESLHNFVNNVLPEFGPYEDAMVADEWRLNHSLLSSSLNLGMLHPQEVADAADGAYRAGRVPLASAEGFVRQIIGWREYVWGLYWLWGPAYRAENSLVATHPVPPAFTFDAPTKMRCVEQALDGVRQRAYAHHIQRLMVLGNLAMLVGVDPWEMTRWFWRSFVDGAEWVMLANVIGMSQYADGGRMSTKPYAAGGAYINRMSNCCKDCVFDPKKRVGEDACPFTSLYWDFVARHESKFEKNPRMVTQVRAAQKLNDLPAVRARAAEVSALLLDGRL